MSGGLRGLHCPFEGVKMRFLGKQSSTFIKGHENIYAFWPIISAPRNKQK